MANFSNCGKCGLPLKKKDIDSGYHPGCQTTVLPGQISFAEQDKNFMDPIITKWNNLYPSNWKGMIVEEAFAHPAKFSNKLIRKIYDHMREEGWLHPGDIVVDPFGGVALGALDAMRIGCAWRGCELEERFIEWGNKNIAFWNSNFSIMPKWCKDAVLLQGDSRNLIQVLQNHANAVVSSPPYTDAPLVPFMRGEDAGKLRVNRGQAYSATVSSPPFSDTLSLDTLSKDERRALAREKGISNAEHVSPIDMEKVGKRSQANYAGVVSSPPYAGMQIEKNAPSIDLEKMYEVYKASGGGQSFEAFCKTQLKHSEGYVAVVSSPPENIKGGTYGKTSAQLGAMKATEKGFQAAVSSPPFLQTTGGTNVTSVTGPLADKAILDRHAAGNASAGYGDADGNMGSTTPDDFWTSAKIILEQVYQILEPGGHACWVVKDYVKGGKKVPFCTQWRALCESVGFVTIHEHHAMLVKNIGLKTTTLEGETVSKEKSSKSFFRRIAEKKGSPPIDFETIYCMVKPSVEIG